MPNGIWSHARVRAAQEKHTAKKGKYERDNAKDAINNNSYSWIMKEKPMCDAHWMNHGRMLLYRRIRQYMRMGSYIFKKCVQVAENDNIKQRDDDDYYYCVVGV